MHHLGQNWSVLYRKYWLTWTCIVKKKKNRMNYWKEQFAQKFNYFHPGNNIIIEIYIFSLLLNSKNEHHKSIVYITRVLFQYSLRGLGITRKSYGLLLWRFFVILVLDSSTFHFYYTENSSEDSPLEKNTRVWSDIRQINDDNLHFWVNYYFNL